MTYTETLNLRKPDLDDNIRIDDINQNSDSIDAAVVAIHEKLAPGVPVIRTFEDLAMVVTSGREGVPDAYDRRYEIGSDLEPMSGCYLRLSIDDSNGDAQTLDCRNVIRVSDRYQILRIDFAHETWHQTLDVGSTGADDYGTVKQITLPYLWTDLDLGPVKYFLSALDLGDQSQGKYIDNRAAIYLAAWSPADTDFGSYVYRDIDFRLGGDWYQRTSKSYSGLKINPAYNRIELSSMTRIAHDLTQQSGTDFSYRMTLDKEAVIKSWQRREGDTTAYSMYGSLIISI